MKAVVPRAAARTAVYGQRSGALLTNKRPSAPFFTLQHGHDVLQRPVLISRAFAGAPQRRDDQRKYAWAETDIAPPSPGRGIIGRSGNVDVTKNPNPFQRWHWLWKMLGFLNEDDRLFRQSTAVETTEHDRVIQTLHDLPKDRKAYRMVGGVLVERTVQEVLPAVTANREGIAQVLAQLNESIKQKEKEADEWQRKYNIKVQQ
ncbi:hypothetical protein PsorP6_013020 [Peronosclerospora sorghi]|uniref:Uncharacterized protein n=1 Tax=Peronosclerospora sorghi TaxID=230839 RepID=A0ACC0WI07_9STRA|nr:hypothetical protein PsorP6_013020 [Peronosclerospora sorghi]